MSCKLWHLYDIYFCKSKFHQRKKFRTDYGKRVPVHRHMMICPTDRALCVLSVKRENREGEKQER